MTTSTLDKPIARPYMEMEDIFCYARRNRVWFCYTDDGRVGLWSCGRKLSMPFKRGVYKHESEILARMRSHHPRVCPARDVGHWQEWVYFPVLDKHVCLLCEQLAA